MAARDEAPEQAIRRWLDEEGSATVGMDALAQSWRLESVGAADRRKIAAALGRVGVLVDPPLERAGKRDKLTLRLTAEQGSEAGAGAPAAAEAEAARQAAPARAAGSGRRAPLRRFRHLRPQTRRPRSLAPPAAPPAEALEHEPPAAPREPSPETEPEMPPGIEPDHQPPPESETEPAPQPPPEPAVAPEPQPRRPLALRLVPIALALMVLGSLGPWAKNIFVTDYGIDRAGYVVLAAALVAGVLLLLHARASRRSVLPLLAALAATAAVVVVAADFRELVDDEFVGPAWGLYAAFAGSAALVGLSMSLLTRR